MPEEDLAPSRCAVDALHTEVQERADALARRHAARLQCQRGCSSCCQDDLRVLRIEADYIRAHHRELLDHGAPHPPGACAFLDGEGACRVYAHRPYVCRTQGLPLLWFEENADEEIVERRDICPLNLEGPRLEGLPHDALWPLGAIELRLVEIEERFGGGRVERVSLRSLFARSEPSVE